MGGKGSGGFRENARRPTINTNRVKMGIMIDPGIREKIKVTKIKDCNNFSDKIEKILQQFLKRLIK